MSLHDPLIRKLMTRQDLTRAESADLMADLMSTDSEGWRFLAFSVASQTKGETALELLGMYDGMYRLTGPYDIELPARLMDVSSTGGSGVRKINVSTLTALITGDLEVAVVKHSFFRVTSVTGSADALQAVGLPAPAATLPMIERALKEVGVAFYSPIFVSPELGNLVRFGLALAEKKVGVSTPFHLIAPLFTPLKLTHRMFGINHPGQFDLIVEVFRGLGYEGALAVRGLDGLDEVSIAAPTRIKGFKGAEEIDFILEPEQVGLKRAPQSAVQPADARESLGDFLRIICGRETGPKRDLVALNCGVVFYLTDRAPSIEAGIELAIRRLTSGEVEAKLQILVEQMGSPATLQAARREYLSP
ncbi:MAG TPA: anthranilate phosphoribosyltransferase [Thermoanaerobaculia bacterium]|nr:anthranilate phosphoribosyltransferase [Thermoanaerobaculia bacterium]